MAWIRRVRTASGATAVQIAESVGGRRRIVAHLGSAHTEAELGLLISRARELLEDPGQGEFELGIEPVARKATLVGPAGDAALFEVDGPSVRGLAAVAAPRVVSTASRVLYDVLASVFTSLGFDGLGDRVFRDLVIARIVEPTSIRDTGRVLIDLGRKPASEKTMRRALTRAHTDAYRDQIARLCFAHALNSGDVSLCLYDVTTLYFEADKEDDLRKVGYSKERRVDPQIVVGLLVDRHGFPLEIGCFEGNKAETLTLLPVIRQFQARHRIKGMVVVADAGMLSATNLRELDQAGLGFIVGSRTTKAPIDLESHYRWHGDYFTDGQIIDTITPRTGANRDNDPALKAEPVWNPRTHTSSWRAVWAYAATRAARDNKTLNAQEAKARAVVAGEKTTRTPRFVTVNGDARTLDETSLARARKLIGLKGYVTNIPHNVMSPSEVTSNYHDLWHVEQSFRMSKTDLAARPMFHHTKDAIEAHLTIVFTALAVTREVQTRTGLAIRNVLRQLRPLRSATLAINDATQTFPPQIDPERQAIIDALTPSGPQALTK
ncbi:IS1634 family transposase [Plantactinospora sp. S1510]|uniref:IS1634 family transposase n=1 Tax=Plantactinospora alkalitolerans TaxID=2789879 RepID=A0ABS0GMI8_9ACTN|nr:IS1634 family transposase [Plantactinospora alkalitolerans]MBF9127402.1 IS1634 family transposase [Plantactinospora alkalitolerans]